MPNTSDLSRASKTDCNYSLLRPKMTIPNLSCIQKCDDTEDTEALLRLKPKIPTLTYIVYIRNSSGLGRPKPLNFVESYRCNHFSTICRCINKTPILSYCCMFQRCQQWPCEAYRGLLRTSGLYGPLGQNQGETGNH